MDSIFSPADFFNPQLGAGAQAFVRAAYGVLLLGTLLWALPHWRRFFLSERWGGYAHPTREGNAVQSPRVMPAVLALWFACGVLIVLGWWSVWVALVNLLLCRYFFVRMRWRGALRGMGAPGFMTYWLGAVVFLLELTSAYAPAERPLALLVAQVDFAFIMLSAGLYKVTAGYARNDGMELGMVNPEWGYWWWLWKRVPPGHLVFRVLNQLAWSTEVVAGLLMLLPRTRFLGGLLILLSFIFIATQIRLALLCETVILCCFLFFHPGSLGDQLTSWLLPQALAAPVNPALAVPGFVGPLVGAALWAYLALLPLAHAGLFYNFYAEGRLPSLPRPVQRALELYTNFFGIIIWRVFSVDVVNFYPVIQREPRGGGERRLYSRYGLRGGLRYNHVAESITVTTVFTTLKYYPSNFEMFKDRLLRYARTVPRRADEVVVFEYVSIQKQDNRFVFKTVAEFTADPEAGSVEERTLDHGFSVRRAHEGSPVREGLRPGSYVPRRGDAAGVS